MRGADLAHRAWTIALRPQEITDALALGEGVRVMREVEVVTREEPEDEPSGLRFSRGIARRHETAVMDDREHELGRNYHVTAPGLLLQRNRGRACRDISGHVDPEFRHE